MEVLLVVVGSPGAGAALPAPPLAPVCLACLSDEVSALQIVSPVLVFLPEGTTTILTSPLT